MIGCGCIIEQYNVGESTAFAMNPGGSSGLPERSSRCRGCMNRSNSTARCRGWYSGSGRRIHARRLAAASLVLLAAYPSVGAAQDGSAQLRMMATQLDEARATAIHLLAPKSFERALDRFEDATRRFERGRVDADFQDLLVDARSRLEDAERIADAARPVFGAVLAARAAASAGQAEARAAPSWQRAEAALEDAGRRFEREDREGAVERASRAAELYRRAARAGWRDRLLGAAIQARAAAMTAGASELAPDAFADGERFLAAGETDIEADRPDEGTAREGALATEAFERAARIAALADSVRRRVVTVERLVDAHESDLAGIAQMAGVEARRGRTAETAERIADELSRLQSENRRLDLELQAARASGTELSERVTSLEERLADSEQRFIEARNDLFEVRRRDDRLREAQGLFTPAEGEVLLSGNRLVLRLFGLTFESGRAEIDARHHPLLTKVQRVITTFEGAGIRIEGHTDSQGGAEANRALSQRRAIAVREHLLSRIPIPSSRIEAVGLGEEQPIGSNETAEGRARNRRIEVVITLPGG